VEDADPVVVIEESVAAKNSNYCAEESDNGNSNVEVGVEYGFERFEAISIRYVGGGYCNSIIEDSYCVMDSCY